MVLLVAAIALSIFTFGIGFGFFTPSYGVVTGTATATTLQLVAIALTLLSTTLGLVGSATEAFYTESPENCQGFVPTCTWTVGIDTFEKDGGENASLTAARTKPACQ